MSRYTEFCQNTGLGDIKTAPCPQLARYPAEFYPLVWMVLLSLRGKTYNNALEFARLLSAGSLAAWSFLSDDEAARFMSAVHADAEALQVIRSDEALYPDVAAEKHLQARGPKVLAWLTLAQVQHPPAGYTAPRAEA
jgi:hypothetical protein